MLYCNLLGSPVEDGTAVHVLPLVLGHCLGAGLGREDAVVAVPLQLWQKELVELICLHLLHHNTPVAKCRNTIRTFYNFSLKVTANFEHIHER